MKNSRLVKMLFTIIMGIIMCAVMVGQVRAVDYQDLSSAINGTSTSNSSSNSTKRTNNTAGSSSLNSASNNTLRTNSSNTANTSTYNNTSLPNTGIGDSVPVVLLVVVFGISAVYAYKKIKEYKNI